MNKAPHLINWEQDSQNIVLLTIDDPQQTVNTMNEAFLSSLTEVVEKLTNQSAKLAGVIITSAKKTFFAGGDLKLIKNTTSANLPDLAAYLQQIKTQLRNLELLNIPVVAALNGSALGGGLELALACHYRIAVDNTESKFGFPEVNLGLLPGGGGVTRAVRKFGIQVALTELLLTGRQYPPQAAKKLGLIDEVVATPEELIPLAKKFILANPTVQQPWDKENYRLPGGKPTNPSLAANLPAFPANLRKQLKGAPFSAPVAIMSTAIEGASVDLATALTIESRYFLKLASGSVAKNMLQAFFFDLQNIKKGENRPANYPVTTFKKIMVVGAGMMGAAIAYTAAKAGLEVILKDISFAAASKGKAYSERLVAKEQQRQKISPAKGVELLARITPTDKYPDLTGVDLVIEAVWERAELKQQVYRELKDLLPAETILGTNTSTLPIQLLSTGLPVPENFIGIHFFSPADKMPLVEIIKGAATSPATLAKVMDFTLQIKKTPIVVNDQQGFFTSRVIAAYLGEALAALGEGVRPSRIEQAALQAGYPVGPLQLTDELTLTLAQTIRQTNLASKSDSTPVTDSPADQVVNLLVDKYQRTGKIAGAGFYNYDSQGKRQNLWEKLVELFPPATTQPSLIDLQERMLFIEALETVRCLEEGVLNSVLDANIGSLLGIGFPAWTGGVLQYINQYPGGLGTFITRANQLATKYGPQFTPPALLLTKHSQQAVFKD